jgi:hypothetical protein
MKKMKIKIIRKGKEKIRYINGCDGCDEINLCSNINNKDYFLIKKTKKTFIRNFIFLYLDKLHSRL